MGDNNHVKWGNWSDGDNTGAKELPVGFQGGRFRGLGKGQEMRGRVDSSRAKGRGLTLTLPLLAAYG